MCMRVGRPSATAESVARERQRSRRRAERTAPHHTAQALRDEAVLVYSRCTYIYVCSGCKMQTPDFRIGEGFFCGGSSGDGWKRKKKEREREREREFMCRWIGAFWW